MLCVLYTRVLLVVLLKRYNNIAFCNQRQQFCLGPKISNVIRAEHHFLIRIGTCRIGISFDGAKKDIYRYSYMALGVRYSATTEE